MTYQNWRIETDNENIAWIFFDKANAPVNTLDRPVMEEFANILQELGTNKNIKGAVIASGKKTGFIAGADIEQFGKFKDLNEGIMVLKLGQEVFNRLEALPFPTVAMIDGFCLGGGMELALACTYRIAEESSKTRLGLPEVMLGIHPGWGGTVRLPNLIGATAAFDLMLTGRTLSGKQAAKIGLADAAVRKPLLMQAAKFYVTQKPAKRKISTLQSLLNNKVSRQILAYFLRKKVREKANPAHYPSPFQMIDNWEHVGTSDLQVAYDREAKTCGRLFFSDTCQNLVRVFFLQNRMKALAKESNFKAEHVHVIGAGTMGGDIAAWCALRGIKVTLEDLDPKFVAQALKRAYKLFQSKLKEPHLIQAAYDRLVPDVKGLGVKNADVIIEAIVENLDIKQKTFARVESLAKPDAIIATNTSSIPLDEINTVMKNPERLVGIHFFNPVAKMMLVEVVKGNKTDATILQKSISFVRQIDRLPLPVKSSPGFLVNRILMPYLLEAVDLVKEGVPMQAIDDAMKEFGMPMGPITLADTVGLDVCLSVAEHLGKYFPVNIPSELKAKVAEKKLGKKTNAGFYKYDKNGKQIKSPNNYSKPLSQIADRLVLRMLQEAFACLEEGVIEDGDLLDAGMIFGTGFAPFRGGPINYARVSGVAGLYAKWKVHQQASASQTISSVSEAKEI